MVTDTLAGGPRLTSLSHGGGCGCKIAPGVLAELLRETAVAPPLAALLVGRETADDAAVYQLNDEQAIVATTDFFMPIVDDPFDFGRIAAANALSDVYAMGGSPLFALAIVGMPVNVLPPAVIRAILKGGEAVCAAAGIPVAGGHSIDSVEPIYGLVAIGVVAPRDLKRNCTARAGDALVLGKPLGVGILAAALKHGALGETGYRTLVDTTTRLNLAGPGLAKLAGVHALTDVTGFGLAGHLLEICRGSKLGAEVRFDDLPVLPEALQWVKEGTATGASDRNWKGYGHEVRMPAGAPEWKRKLITDPQTSGGLLVACAPAAEKRVVEEFRRQGFPHARRIGSMMTGASAISVT